MNVPNGERCTRPDRQAIAYLESQANQARQLLLRTVHKADAGHVGGPLSSVDILTALYFRVLRVSPQRPEWEARDRFILSKGHASVALYAVMALRGYFPVDELFTFDAVDSRLQGHPDMTALPGIDMSSGSLGQGLSPGIGMALGARLAGLGFHTWVLLGDGEIQEGQVWEAAFVAARYGLDNLTAVVDYNKLQLWGWTGTRGSGGRETLVTIPDPAGKFAAWGWDVREIDGHDMGAIVAACEAARDSRDGRPSALIAHTIKGKGVSFMENRVEWHARPPTADELARALAELEAAGHNRVSR